MTDDTCGHPTTNGDPCQNPPTDGDTCWLDAHGGNAQPSGRPPTLDDDLITDICDLVADGTLVKDVWAWLDIPRRTWESWRRKGREDLEEKDHPTTIYGEFLWRLTRAEHKARERWHRFLRDGLVVRKGVETIGEGEDTEVKVLPKRLDP